MFIDCAMYWLIFALAMPLEGNIEAQIMARVEVYKSLAPFVYGMTDLGHWIDNRWDGDDETVILKSS